MTQDSPSHRGGRLSENKDFWVKELQGRWPSHAFPTDSPDSAELPLSGFTSPFPKELSQRILDLVKGSPQGVFLVLAAGVGFLAARYSGRADQLLAMSGLQLEDPDRGPGQLTPLPLLVDGHNGFRQLLGEVRTRVTGAVRHQAISLSFLAAELGFKEEKAFQTLVRYRPIHPETSPDKLSPPLVFSFDLQDQQIRLELGFRQPCFSKATAEGFCRHLQNFFRQGLEDPQKPLHKIEILELEERRHLIEQLNDTARLYPNPLLLHQYLERQAHLTPQSLALIFEEESWTFERLFLAASHLAADLRSLGFGPESIAAVCLKRSPALMVALFGILQAGGAWLPIDPDTPPDRAEFMLADSQAKVLLSLNPGQFSFAGPVLDPLTTTAPLVAFQEQDPQNRAYVIYTSGSTGKPKGVQVPHAAVVNRILWMQEQYPLTAEDVILQKTPFTFDVSVWELFWWSFCGARLFVAAPEAEKDPARMVDTIEKGRVTTLHFVPSMLSVFLTWLESSGQTIGLQLKRVFASGEALTPAQVSGFARFLPQAELHNLYGPTEAAIDVTWFACRGQESRSRIPIGVPISNIQCHVLSRDLELLPAAAQGQLGLAGTGLARGYLNRPRLTAERFCPNPYGEPGSRLYLTGDLARRLADGNIDFLGRIDFQVKIRGFRIELGEISNCLESHPAISQAAVLVRLSPSGEPFLAAWYVTSAPVSVAELRTFMQRTLPEYMIPTSFMALPVLPTNASGKLDRKALPMPILENSTPYVPPRNHLEQELALIWSRVLESEAPGIDDDFFRLGGHSLKVAMAINGIQKRLGLTLPMSDFFEHATIRSLALHLAQSRQSEYQPLPLAGEQPDFPVSGPQKRLLILDQVEGTSIRYNMPVAIKVTGPFQLENFARALNQLVQRHQIFRTGFRMKEEQRFVQQIPAEARPAVAEISCREAEIEQAFRNFIVPFEPETPPLLRACVARTGEHQHYLFLDMHHLVSDGVTTGIIARELAALYAGQSLPEPRRQFKDYAVWQQTRDLEPFASFWLELHNPPAAPLDLFPDYPRPAIQGLAGEMVRFRMEPQQTEALRLFCGKNRCTSFMLLLALWQSLLARYSGQDDLVTGSPVAGRNHPDCEDMPGMFTNLLAWRFQPTADKTFLQFLEEVRQIVLAGFQHQDYPFEVLVDRLALNRDMGRNPLCDNLLVFQERFHQKAGEVQFQIQPLHHGLSKFDLTLIVLDGGSELELELEYASSLFSRERIQKMAHHFQILAADAIACPQKPLSDLNLLDQAERMALLRQNPEVSWPEEETLVSLFDRAAATYPQHRALVYADMSWTYAQLLQRVNALAQRLREHGVGADVPVALLMARGPHLIAAMLAVLKAGGAYLPIDPNYPEERIEFTLKDSGTQILLCDPDLSWDFAGVILFPEKEILQDRAVAPEVEIHPRQGAYIIYTSGTTGRPKGVVIEHRNVVRLMFHQDYRFHFGPGDVWTMFHSPAFDFSVWEMYGALLYGGCLVITPTGIARDPMVFLDLLRTWKVSVLNQTPGAFAQLIAAQGPEPLADLRYVIFGGEALQPGMLQEWSGRHPQVKLVNMYGITETTVHVTFKLLQAQDLETRLSNIGGPLPTLETYVLDDFLNPVPTGVPGELAVGGLGVARGYLNRPGLTASRFVPHPFKQGQRLYRSGDRARRLQNGELAYLGRIDHQIKLRGFRIEPGEIEHQLLRHPLIAEAAVGIYRDSNGRDDLVAWYSGQKLSGPSLRQFLGQTLPEHMIPLWFTHLEKLPLTRNRKIDRRALPEPEREVQSSGLAARDEIEALLVRVWREVLDLESLGVDDNFFSSGGDSIKAIQVAARLRSSGYQLKVQDLFTHQTIAALRPAVRPLTRHIDQGAVVGPFELTPIQQWFFETGFADPHHWNQVVVLFRQQGFDRDRLRLCFSALTRHHDVLRALFPLEGQIRTAFCRPPETSSFDLIELTEEDPQKQGAFLAEQQTGLNLELGPLVRLVLIKTGRGDHLAVIIHHLLIDGVSWRFLVEDLATAWLQAEQGQAIQLPPKTDAYSSWAPALASYAQTPEILAETPFWQKISQVKQPDLLPCPSAQKGRQTLSRSLSCQQTADLQNRAGIAYNTEINHLLVAALGLAIHSVFDLKQFVFAMEGHGRDQAVPEIDINRTIGWFTAIYPVLLDLTRCSNLAWFIKQTKETLESIPGDGLGCGLLRYCNHNQEIFPQMPELGFNYLGEPDRGLANKVFERSNLEPGPTTSPKARPVFALEINAVILDSALQINCSADQEYLPLLKSLAEELVSSLSRIIDHCLNQKGTELTPTDVSANGLDLEDMEDLFSALED